MRRTNPPQCLATLVLAAMACRAPCAFAQDAAPAATSPAPTAPAATTGASIPVATPESQGMRADSLAALDKVVQEFVDRNYVVGAELVVVKNGHLVHQAVFGLRDREADAPWTPNTVCNIRSMTKALTGAAAEILIDRGQLALDDPVSKFLPGFDNERSRSITIDQLMSHRSGLPLTIMTKIDEFSDLRAQANAVGERGPESEPGSKFWYSDAGADALGAVVEVVSGQRLDAFVEHELLEPLGMTRTFYGIDSADPRLAEVAPLYAGATGAWARVWGPEKGAFYPFAWGSQTLYSTASDYARFLGMWLEGGKAGPREVLSSAAISRTLEPVTRMSMLGSDQPFPTEFPGLEVWYGRMAVLHVPQGQPGAKPVIVGHSGSDGTVAWAWPAERLVVLYFTQSRGGLTAIRLEEPIERLLLHPDAPVVEVAVPERFRPYLGTYVANFATFRNERFTVKARDGKLVLDIPSQMAFELLEPEPGVEPQHWRFAIAPDAVAVSFERDADGNVNLMHLHQSGVTLDVPREGTALAEQLAKADVVDAERVKPFVGRYFHPEANGEIEVFLDDQGTLAIRTVEGIPVQLRPTDEPDRWLLKMNPAIVLVFDRAADGTVVSLTRHFNDTTLVMPRRP
ncbi:MAG: beta-lactamase family protein [Phycisphaerales bacterium]|nr:beta-lactamase family protein [Phycisphaerales bacterium]